ncbi:hypothetical protein [Nocardia sp. alder85J]|uniref:hypothetical protein n=1 Tax=Nocardia sp. alder85J TaxID=2862949 RepID=UPI001CD1D844|nr:hypothetical protein [Nocardia sp. alder85J]MCX4092587.1 hypothetical protein [Nocardia sp. alder85J]
MTTVSADNAFLPASLESTGPCPARADYLELRFATSVGHWTWCVPQPGSEPPDPEEEPVDRLAIAMGRYGIQAYRHTGEGTGTALPSAAAIPLILDGIPVRVARTLIESGRSG